MDNSTIKEICDVVTEEVMKQIQQNLSAMKPDLIQAITEASAVKATETVRKNIDVQKDTVIRQLQQKNAEAEKRISQLEMRITKLSALQPDLIQQKYTELEKRIAQLEMQIKKLSEPQQTTSTASPTRITAKAVDGINTLSAEQIDDILSFPNFYREANGWIYYIKVVKEGYNSYGELYKVRPDGTKNQKIFAGKVSLNESHAIYHFEVKGDKLYFKDNEYIDRIIRV